jgi:UDP-2-acetamido-3-amino-2,3-dideoxy-glucuronate N-acetyltransferase
MTKLLIQRDLIGVNSLGKKHILKNIGKTTVVVNYNKLTNGLVLKNQQIKPGDTITIYYQTGTFNTASPTQIQTISLTDFPEKITTTTTTQNYVIEMNNSVDFDIQLNYQNSIIKDMEPKPTKILVATLIWRRFDLFRKLYNHYNNLGLDVLAIGSEGDVSRKVCEELGCAYIEHPNEPLGSKMNRRIDYFLENTDYTHILLVGSDDFIDRVVLDKIYENIPNYDIITWSDLYYLDDLTGEILYSEGYKNSKSRQGEPVAPGRCISRTVIQELHGQLWDQHITKSPDSHSSMRLRNFSRKIMFSCKEIGGIILDVKTKDNKNSFEKIKNLPTTFEVSHEEKIKINELYNNPNITFTAAKTSKINEFAKISRNVQIGEFCFIDENVEIGEGTIIENFVELRSGTKIGKNCYIDSRVTTFGDCTIGDNTTIGTLSIIRKNCQIGSNCSFTANCEIRDNVKIGNNTKFGSRCTISANSEVGENVTIKYGFVLTDTPDLKNGGQKVVGSVDDNSLIGANVVLMPGFKVGKNCIIGASSQIRCNIPDNEIWYGTPAKFHKKNIE